MWWSKPSSYCLTCVYVCVFMHLHGLLGVLVFHGTSTRRLSSRLLNIAGREHPVSPHIQYICSFSAGIEHSTLDQSILDAPTGTNQANGSRLDPVPSHPFSIYKTGLAYNEKHYLPPGHITLPAADGGVMECGPKNDPITQIVFLHRRIIYHDTRWR